MDKKDMMMHENADKKGSRNLIKGRGDMRGDVQDVVQGFAPGFAQDTAHGVAQNIATQHDRDLQVPDKFRDPKTGDVRVDDVLKSYLELERQMAVRGGAPKSPDEYCVTCEHPFFDVDPVVNARLHAKGFSEEQAQEVYDLAAEVMAPMVAQIAQDFQADRELSRLEEYFGGRDQWRFVSRQLLAFGKKALPEPAFRAMAGSYEGVLALHNLMQSQEPNLPSDMGAGPVGNDANGVEVMMKDPRYWRDRDPGFVRRVTQAFQARYQG